MLTVEEERELDSLDEQLRPLDEFLLQVHALREEYERKVARVSVVTQQELSALNADLSDIEREFQEAVEKAEADRIRQGVADL